MSMEFNENCKKNLNYYFRGNMFQKDSYGIFKPSEIPENIPIYMMKQVRKGLTKENVIPFLSWFEIEMTKTETEGWTLYSPEGGFIQTEFGVVSYQTNFDSIIIDIEKCD